MSDSFFIRPPDLDLDTETDLDILRSLLEQVIVIWFVKFFTCQLSYLLNHLTIRHLLGPVVLWDLSLCLCPIPSSAFRNLWAVMVSVWWCEWGLWGPSLGLWRGQARVSLLSAVTAQPALSAPLLLYLSFLSLTLFSSLSSLSSGCHLFLYHCLFILYSSSLLYLFPFQLPILPFLSTLSPFFSFSLVYFSPLSSSL